MVTVCMYVAFFPDTRPLASSDKDAFKQFIHDQTGGYCTPTLEITPSHVGALAPIEYQPYLLTLELSPAVPLIVTEAQPETVCLQETAISPMWHGVIVRVSSRVPESLIESLDKLVANVASHWKSMYWVATDWVFGFYHYRNSVYLVMNFPANNCIPRWVLISAVNLLLDEHCCKEGKGPSVNFRKLDPDTQVLLQDILQHNRPYRPRRRFHGVQSKRRKLVVRKKTRPSPSQNIKHCRPLHIDCILPL